MQENTAEQQEVELSNFRLDLQEVEVDGPPQIAFHYRSKHYHLKPSPGNSQKNIFDYSHSITISTQASPELDENNQLKAYIISLNNMVPLGMVSVDIAQVLKNCDDLQSLKNTIHEFSVLNLAKEPIGTFEMVISPKIDINEVQQMH